MSDSDAFVPGQPVLEPAAAAFAEATGNPPYLFDLPPAEGPRALPQTLWDAAQRLKGSETARDLFGGEFVDHFSATREWEEREFRKHISDWELARYFEAI